jgi:hypothetical protein
MRASERGAALKSFPQRGESLSIVASQDWGGAPMRAESQLVA